VQQPALRACELRQCNVVQIYAPLFTRSASATMSPLWHFKSKSERHPSSALQRKSLHVKFPHQRTPRCVTTILPPLALPDMALYRNGGATRRAQGRNALLKRKRVRTARWYRSNALTQSEWKSHKNSRTPRLQPRTLLLPDAV
jgi:hypothetical protein